MKTKYEDNVDTTKAITHLSLCAGYDGIGLGLERIFRNLRTVSYVEVEAFAVANLVAKMESEQLDAAPIYTDVKTFPYKEFLGRVDILSGGFPCQPFSNAGARKGVEDPRHLYPYISRGIEECKPRIVFLENVEGIISSKTAEGESVLHYVLKDLERLGYQATAGVFSASEIGFPHQRKRVFILGQKMVESNDNGYSENRRGNEEERRISEEHRSEVCGGLSNRTSEELGNSSSNRRNEDRRKETKREVGESQQGRMQKSKGRCDEFSDTECSRMRGGRSSEECGDDTNRIQSDTKKRNELRSETEGCGGNISDTNGKGLERHTTNDTERQVSNSTESSSELGNSNRADEQSCELRQRETQYRRTSTRDIQSVARPNEPQHEWEEPRVKPKLGRTTNGTSSRVDRLRLLGNGVVPSTAERAFIVLINRFLVDSEE